jgi:hypothetical protein
MKDSHFVLLIIIVGLALVGCKLSGLISLSWWIVLAPIWLPIATVIGFTLLLAIFILVGFLYACLKELKKSILP